jgi:quinolinate synthase
MVQEARTTACRDVVIGTEKGIIYRLAKENPSVTFYPARESAVCAHQKMTTLAKVLRALETDTFRIEVPAGIADRARGAIDAMLRIA